MSTVTKVVQMIKNPSQFISIGEFKQNQFNDEFVLNEAEVLKGNIVGIAVDALTRTIITKNGLKAFFASLTGARNIGLEKMAKDLLDNVTGTDDLSILNACKLAHFDILYRSPATAAAYFKLPNKLELDQATTENIRILVNRTLAYLSSKGPLIDCGFSFEGGYTDVITAGDGDYICGDTMIDVKVLKQKFLSSHALQVLIYYLLGLNTEEEEYTGIKHLALFNPRLNIEYVIDISNIPEEQIIALKNLVF
ncbi:MAG: hypothetical protein RR909_02350 [Bacilli bacterium]